MTTRLHCREKTPVTVAGQRGIPGFGPVRSPADGQMCRLPVRLQRQYHSGLYCRIELTVSPQGGAGREAQCLNAYTYTPTGAR